MKYHAITTSFAHCLGSCAYHPPKNNWNFHMPSSIDENNPTVFVDENVRHGLSYEKNTYKFGWFCESSEVIKDHINWAVNNIETLKNSYKKIFVNDESLLNISDIFDLVPSGSNMPWIKERIIYKKNKLASIIMSNKNFTIGHKVRHEIANKYESKIDLYGHKYKYIEDKKEGLAPYMFSFCIENANYDTCYTEKLTDAIACGTIPIWWGTKKVSNIFNKNGIIFLDEKFDINMLTPELYYSKLESIKENLEILSKLEPADNIVQKKMVEKA